MLRKITDEANQKVVVWTLIIGILFSAGLYIFFVHQTVFYVVKRGEISDKIAEINVDITSLQSKQIALSNKITSDMAFSLGYKEAKPIFIPKQSISLASRANNL